MTPNSRANHGFRLVNVAAFFLALVGACWVLHQFLPPLWVEVVSPKLEHLRSHGDDVDVIFIGSSLVNRQIDPATFDSALRARGISMRSFNMGADGLRFPEVFHVLDRIAAMRLPRLKWVVMESNIMGTELGKSRREGDANTVRAVYWHDWRNTVLMLRKVIQQEQRAAIRTGGKPRLGEIVPGCQHHIGQFIKNSANLGRMVEERPASAGPGAPFQQDSMRGMDFRSTEQGFLGIDLEIPPKRAEKLVAWAGNQKAKGRPAPFKDEITEQAIVGAARRLQKGGTQLALLVTPDATLIKVAYDGLPGTRAMKTFFYLDPGAYPALYEPRHRYNERHLNKTGAELFTKILANDFADHLASGR